MIAEDKDLFVPLFNGKDLSHWKVLNGNKDVWGVDKDGVVFCKPGHGGWLLTEKEYSDFELKVEFKLPKNGNSGIALRTPFQGDPAYTGMEIQLIDDLNWKGLQSWQHTGSIYNVVPASKQANKPIGEWNQAHIYCKGKKVIIKVNGETLVDADLGKYEAEHSKKHPGILRKSGFVGFQSHDTRVEFRNAFIKELK